MGLSIAAEGVPVTDTQFLRYAQIQMPNGVVLEIVEPVADLRRLYHAPIASFSVDDVGEARAEMEAKGVEFVSPLFDAGQGWGWTYFRAPDGNVYQLQGRYGSEQSPTTPTGVGE